MFVFETFKSEIFTPNPVSPKDKSALASNA